MENLRDIWNHVTINVHEVSIKFYGMPPNMKGKVLEIKIGLTSFHFLKYVT